MMVFIYGLIMVKKPLSTKIDNDLQKEVKKLAIDLERPFNAMIEEALRELLKKYEKNTRTSSWPICSRNSPLPPKL